ncbi:MAG: hypothetical protein AB2L17_17180 [Lentimicrobium sp.]
MDPHPDAVPDSLSLAGIVVAFVVAEPLCCRSATPFREALPARVEDIHPPRALQPAPAPAPLPALTARQYRFPLLCRGHVCFVAYAFISI